MCQCGAAEFEGCLKFVLLATDTEDCGVIFFFPSGIIHLKLLDDCDALKVCWVENSDVMSTRTSDKKKSREKEDA